MNAEQRKYSKERYLRNKVKYLARNRLREAINQGRVIKPTICDSCKNLRNLEGHHDDYDKPLDVIWLCRPCHTAKHGRLKNISLIENYPSKKKDLSNKLVPELVPDHLCGNRACVNPEHLKQVDVLRGISISAANNNKTHCIHGHKFDEANTYYMKKRKGRICVTCRIANNRRYRERQREAL